ncbi:MAG TPA: UPF0175 family protein [Rhizomicrobium sp.]|jgi:hypothetical protein|nr:UPF0175 family protein [Rhizomicrobium sp.]
MNVTVRIPDDLATRLGAGNRDLERQALEGLVLEGFRAGRISKDELGQVLGLEGLDQIDGFLKAHDVYEPCAFEEIERDVETLVRLGI